MCFGWQETWALESRIHVRGRAKREWMSWKNKMWSEVAYRAYLQVRKERCGGESPGDLSLLPWSTSICDFWRDANIQREHLGLQVLFFWMIQNKNDPSLSPLGRCCSWSGAGACQMGPYTGSELKVRGSWNLLDTTDLFSLSLTQVKKAFQGIFWLSSGKESACKSGDAKDLGSIPGSGRFPRGGNGNLSQYSFIIIIIIEW